MFHSLQHLSQAGIPHGAVAVLPLGAMESHGPHLPLGTDSLIAEGILDHAAARDTSAQPFVRLPALWLGASAEHSGAGTCSIEPEALIAQIEGAGEGLSRAGIARVLLFNAHGGNVAAAAIAALKLRRRFAMLAASVHWLDYGLPAITPPAPVKDDIHGGWIETSVMLHLAPQRVGKIIGPRPPQAPAASLFPSGPVNWGWLTTDLAEGGWIGWPEKASAALGRALVDHAADGLLGTLRELAAAQWPTR